MRYRRRKYRRKESFSSIIAQIIVVFICYFFLSGALSKNIKQVIPLSFTGIRLILPLIVTICIVIIIREFFRYTSWKKLEQTGILEIDSMSGTVFEQRLLLLYENLGYCVTHVGHSGDGGVDLILEKDGKRTAVQAKRWTTHIGEKAVQEIYTGCRYHHCHASIIVTNNYFTDMAWKVANKVGVWLVDRNGLLRLLEKEREVKQNKIVHTIQNEVNTANSIKTDTDQNSTPPEALVTCIKTCLDAGYDWTSIKDTLLAKGWENTMLQNAYTQSFQNK